MFNFLEATDWSIEWLDAIRKAMPKDHANIYVEIPREDQIVSDLRRISSIPLEYWLIPF